MKISFIGFGNMAKAMAKGLMHNEKNQLSAAAPSLPIGVYEHHIKTYSDNLAVIPDANVIILAVKPAQMKKVLNQISHLLASDCLIISIAAGLSLSWFERLIPKAAIVRAMPNIAVALGKAATPLFANLNVTDQQKQWSDTIFSSLGLTTWARKESEMNAFTALSGSGPAYIFMFMEAMIKAAINLGIENNIAKNFTIQTFQGALSLAAESNIDVAKLREMVTSPAGTTAAALDVLTEHGFDELIYTAMLAATKRACALSELNE